MFADQRQHTLNVLRGDLPHEDLAWLVPEPDTPEAVKPSRVTPVPEIDLRMEDLLPTQLYPTSAAAAVKLEPASCTAWGACCQQ